MNGKKEQEDLKQRIEKRTLEKSERFVRLVGIKTLVCCSDDPNLF